MKNPNTNFKAEANNIRVTPPVHAWHRIETSLDVDHAHRRLRRAKVLNIAASLLLLVSLGVLGLYMSKSNESMYSSYSQSLQHIVIENGDYGIYDIARVKQMSLLANNLND